MSYQPQYQPPQYVQIVKPPSNGQSVAAMILGIVAIVFAVWVWVPVLGLIAAFFAFVPAVIGIVLGHIGVNRSKVIGGIGHGQALTGLILGYISVGLIVVTTFLWMIALAGSAASSNT